MEKIVLIVHNVRSTHNVGSLLRTADGLGVTKVYFTGYTPHPLYKGDSRLPHIAEKLTGQIHKTALGAETSVGWEYQADIEAVIKKLKVDGHQVVALEQAEGSIKLPDFNPADKVAIIVGREVEGIEPEVLAIADKVVEIPMLGQKESLNVAQAAAIALYQLQY